MGQPLRIGIIGAGTNTRVKHIPELKKQPDVEIYAVSNRTSGSSAAVAHEFSIPNVYNSWQELIQDPKIDAVVIGTWPNMHCEITCAALDAGKHVLCEARMAKDLTEARKMLAKAQANPKLVAQIVPSPFGLMHEDFMHEILLDDYIGNLRDYVVIGADDTFFDFSQIIHWRQDAEISGKNILTMGILHETVSRWIPPVKQLYAQTTIFEKERHDPDSPGKLPVTVPDSVQIMTTLENGARGLYHISGVELFGPGKQIHMYGSKGTIRMLFEPTGDKMLVGRIGSEAMREIQLEPKNQRGWRVEEEFISAIRGQEAIKFNSFETAIKYMEFTEAVHLSAASQMPVNFPLPG
jgi:predicted dehydrogenase